jgi:Spy/CpxP family protein refolding chaperone
MRSILIRTIVSGVLAVTFLSVVAPAIVRAQTPDGGPALDASLGRPGAPARLLGPLFPILRRLQLTPDQRGQVRQILLGHREDFRNLIQRAVKGRKALFSAVYLDPFDEGVIRDRSADVAAVQADEAVLRATIRTEIFGVLTPEQLARAIKALERFQQHGRDGSDDGSSPF